MKTKLAFTAAAALALTMALANSPAYSQAKNKWVAAWCGAIQGPYPVGNPSAQPDLSFAFPNAEEGAEDQSFRLMVRPDIWGPQVRIRMSNVLGIRPVTFDGIYVGLQQGSSAVMHGTNRQVSFSGKTSVTIAAGESAWSDAIVLPFAKSGDPKLLEGRRLAVSFHVVGQSGPMTWHAKSLNTSFISRPRAGSVGQSEDEQNFPYSTNSTYFLDAVDMMAPATTQVVAAFGDSITDGTSTTLNGDDRWPDVLSRRLHARYGNRVSVVNAGIGGNQVVGPASYSAQKPFPGGPSAISRVERDLIALSGVSTVIWLEGINDFSKNGNAAVDDVVKGMRDVVARLRKEIPGVRVLGATVTSALGSTSAAHGHVEQDDKRKALNEFIRSDGLFDDVLDFDAATLDTASGGLKAEYVPDGTSGGPGDKLHPNRAGYQAMAGAIPLAKVVNAFRTGRERKIVDAPGSN
jgi:lysophospholipase L1-like esterase